MRSAVLVSPGKIEIREVPTPEPGPGEVRVRLAAVGICGSDVHYYREGRIGSAVVRYPTVLGHEPSGIVEKAGPDTSLAPGTRVAIEPGDPCFACEQCHAGRFNCCPQVRFLASPPIEGVFREFACVSEHCCIPLPDGVSFAEGALLEPMGVGLHAVRLAALEIGETVAIFGGGPIGLVTLLAARLAGAGRIYITDLEPARLAVARELGADAVFDARSGDPVAWLRERTGGRGADATFEAAGVAATVTHACLGARIGGRALLIGIPAEDQLAMPMHECRRRELTIRHVRRSNNEVAPFLRLAGRVPLARLGTHRFPLERLAEAFDLVHRRADGVLRALIEPAPELAGR